MDAILNRSSGTEASEPASMLDRNSRRDQDIKVLYIGGWQRSGSTILGNLLNEVEGVFHAGEICFIWHFGIGNNYLCGCGEPFRTCPCWRAIFEEAFGSMERMKGYKGQRPTSQQLLKGLLVPSSAERLVDSEYLDVLEKLYQAIHAVTGCRLIVDSSKFPAHAFLLKELPAIDLRLVHLIRDPRGTAFSWKRKVARTDMRKDEVQEMPRYSVLDTSLKWLLWNVETSLLQRYAAGYLQVRYEDLMEDPAEWLKRILVFSGLNPSDAPRIENAEVMLGENHTAMGNPSRSKIGAVRLHQDEKWRKEMAARDRALVSLLCWPLMLRYGYRI